MSREIPTLVEPSHDLPIVHFTVVVREGSLRDPVGKDGLARLTARLVRRSTRERDARAVEERIDSLGAELYVESGAGILRFSGVVIRRNLQPLFELLGELLSQPRLGHDDFAQVKRETEAAIVEGWDSDSWLAATGFRRLLFRGHCYERSSLGTRASVASVTWEDASDFYSSYFTADRLLVGLAGDVDEAEARRVVDAHLGGLSWGTGRDPVLAPEPSMPPGRRLRLVDKPDRSQTQIYIGRLGTHPADPDHHALMLGNLVFGGTFTARLMREVRSQRGWSYGASSRAAVGRVRDTWSMWTFPAAGDAAACMALQIELMERWVSEGISQEELDFARAYLTRSHAFTVDTAEKRLEKSIDAELLQLPQHYFEHYLQNTGRVTVDEVNAALKKRLDPTDLAMAVVATGSELAPALRQLPGVEHLEVLPFDQD